MEIAKYWRIEYDFNHMNIGIMTTKNYFDYNIALSVYEELKKHYNSVSLIEGTESIIFSYYNNET
jgi:hypothetical protein